MGWDRQTYTVRLKLTAPMLGSQPSKNIAQAHLASKAEKKMKREGMEREAIEEKLAQDYADLPGELEKQGVTVFFRDEVGVYLAAYQMKGFLKNACAVMKQHGALKQLRSKAVNYLFVDTPKIYLAAPDAILEECTRPLRGETPQGPRTCIAISEMIPAETEFEFQLMVYQGVFDKPLIAELLSYGQHSGILQNRGSGYGTFEVLSIK